MSAIAIFQVMDRVTKIDPDLEGIEPATVQGAIRFENVQFAYPSRPDHPLFKGDLNLQIDALKKVALVVSLVHFIKAAVTNETYCMYLSPGRVLLAVVSWSVK